MISIARRVLSDLHVVLSGTFSGFCTDADRRDFSIDFISSGIHCIHMRMPQCNCVIITSAAFFVVRVMPVEVYGKSWFACLQVRRLYMVGFERVRGIQ